MRITRSVAASVAAHVAHATDNAIRATVGTGYSGKGFRVSTMATPTARQSVWLSAEGEARAAMAYLLGALDAYTDGADMPPFLAAVRESIAWRPEVESALHKGREDGTRARVTA
ncbi:hypothetical protein [Streptomyces sp. NPDC002088]|uniref:hypothetical protein n=1 Tax=Streptomyces sp. NPDC002088 TaxID=3154665 RepID=UPI003333C97C